MYSETVSDNADYETRADSTTGTFDSMSDTPTPETDALEFIAQPGMMPPYNTVPAEFARRLERERDSALKECEREHIRLAACGVVALADTHDSAKEARKMAPEYMSASCGDVARRVDECLQLRAINAELVGALESTIDSGGNYCDLLISQKIARAAIDKVKEAV